MQKLEARAKDLAKRLLWSAGTAMLSVSEDLAKSLFWSSVADILNPSGTYLQC